MPLKRDKAGRLGVEASGGSGGDPAVTVPVTVMNVPSEEFTTGVMESDQGGRIIINQIRKNIDVIRAELH
jgi:hypothetical protein